MKTFGLTCPELDGGRRKARFETSRFPNVEFVNGMSKHNARDPLHIAGNRLNCGFGESSWDASGIAVAYGHLRIWKRVVEAGHLCLILEDDALPVPAWKFDYFKLPAFVESCGISGNWVLSLWRSGVSFYKPFNRKLLQITPSYGNWGTMAYVISLQTARRLIEGFTRIECPIDHYVLGMGFRESPDYRVFVTRKDRIGHPKGGSIRADPA